MPSRDGDTNRVAAVLVAGILALLWADPAFAFDAARAQTVGPPGLIEAIIVALAKRWARQPERAPAPVPVAAPVAPPLPESITPPAPAAPKQRKPRMTLDAWAREYIATQPQEITAMAAYMVYCEECRVRRRKIVARLEFGRAFEAAALALGRQRVKRAGRLIYSDAA